MELATAPSSSPVSGQTSELTTPASPSVAEISTPVVLHMPDLVSEQVTAHPSATAPVASSHRLLDPLHRSFQPHHMSQNMLPLQLLLKLFLFQSQHQVQNQLLHQNQQL